ncbi:MAG: ABC transporter ATP-binding protein [Ruminococcus sp.]|nr:ABC transporter ATP-binding protein [Ruminococcus sp.]
MLAIDMKNLRKEYKELTAVENFSLQVADGEILSLLGMNGAGKTTTIKMLSCLTKPTSGDAFIYGKSIVSQPDEVKQLIGISPQENSFARNLTVEENLKFMCGIYGISKSRTKENTERIVEQLSMQKVLNQRVGKLSGGWQKRLSIAMALVTEPKLLFLDEPTLGLDIVARRELWSVIEKLKGSMTMIITTHYLEESEHLADNIAIMKEGKLKAYGTLEALRQQTGEEKLEDIFLAVSAE